MLHYILQVIFFQLSFLLVYELLLKKETFFTYNRWYLLLSPVIALLLPLLKFEGLSTLVPSESLVLLPEVYLGSSSEAGESLHSSETLGAEFQVNWWWLFYSFGAVLSSLLFIRKSMTLRKLFRGRLVSEERKLRIIQVPNTKIACTFYNTVFLGDQLKESERQQILSHEMVHVRQKHSLDLMFFELQKIIFWFNPLVYVFQAKLAGVHEFIADSQVVKTTEKKSYYQQLLNTAFNTENISFINQFFNHSLIKKRIVMLQKSKSKTTAKLKYLIMVPLMFAMLTYVSCSEDIDVMQEKTSKVSNKDETLKEALWEEITLMEQEGADFADISQAFMIETDKHTKSKEAFYRSQTLMRWLMTNNLKEAEEEGTTNSEMYKSIQKLLDQTYEEYVAHRQTAPERSTQTTITKRVESESIGDVPFAVIEDVPVYPGCEGLASNDAKKACMSEKITKHISEYFNTDLGKALGLKGVNRIYVQFRIEKDGSVTVLGARAPHPRLQQEAEEVVNSLPKMAPGKQSGKEVGVLYSLPITFNADE